MNNNAEDPPGRSEKLIPMVRRAFGDDMVIYAGPYHEFKGFNTSLPFECTTSDLKIIDGAVSVPSGPGLGITIDPEYIRKHEFVQAAF
jgi:hypothetical protein